MEDMLWHNLCDSKVKRTREAEKMKWLEVIMMQVAEQNRETVHQKVAGLISEIGPNSGIERTLLFRHAMTENGLNIHIYWDSDQV